ncbi:cupin domain-containing protein [Aequorivita xiaoshiensis]|uniref:Cupin domain-containing protein n=1 Tax=Aequorivita xiaoshiensis TaxID=2874476 RepID=A0A9X1R0C1_9FLAO|nr:cupin domain-containing protein [Aequorivita xiaoshiensis]MCG2430390.1 cupin domain-containing protein [Aequorivita xiaoshiensis]
MSNISNPLVKLIEEGKKLIIKQMSAKSGQLLPKHQASDESVVVVGKGECIINFSEDKHYLKQGDSLIIPQNVWHQIKVIQDFKALHIMPKNIQFEFTK